jgi:hypothetical protein
VSETSVPDYKQYVTELEFTLRDPSYPFVGITVAEDCRVELAEILPRTGRESALYVNVTGVCPDRVLPLAAECNAVEPCLLREYNEGGLFEFLVSEEYPAITLARLGARPRTVRAADGEETVVAEVPQRYDPSAIVEEFLANVPEANLTTKRPKDAITPLFTESAFDQVLYDRLTERQREVLRVAFEAGYYDWPRECTGEEMADTLGISSATFSEHIHAAERKLLTLAFEGK